MNLIQLDNKKNIKHHKYIVGIDLGTTHSLIALKKSPEEFIIFTDENGKNFIHSVVSFSDNNIHVGKMNNTEHSITSIKRLMNEDTNNIASFKQKNSCHIDLQTQTINIKGQTWNPIEISSLILKKLKIIAENHLNEEIDEAVITIPAYFNENARNNTKKAAELAGLKVRRLINEPTAAALACKIDLNKNGVFLVYDLGGGTFDISLLNIRQGVIKVIAVDGSMNMGGDDIDNILATYIIENLKLANLQHQDQIYINKQAKIIKEKLSQSLNIHHQINLQDQNYNIEITQDDFEQLIMNFIQKTIDIAQKVIDENNVKDKLNGIILVGGSTKIPLIKQKLKTIHHNLLDNLNPEEIVVQGAAIQAYNLGNKTGDLLIDVLPISLGIENANGIVEKIISRNAPLPASNMETFTTSIDNQSAIEINVYQGELENACNNLLIGKFKLNNIPPMPAHKPLLEVEFKIDVDGLLNISAWEKNTGIRQTIDFNLLWKNSSEQIHNFLIKQLSEINQDKEMQEIKELDLSIKKIINLLEGIKNKFNQQTQEQIEQIIDELCEANTKKQKISLLQNTQQKVQHYINKIINKNTQ